ncbi:MAG: glycosyltransferase [Candidatus Bathyarchaeia archaeon]
MKCCIISPYPPDKCGIALYTFKLTNELTKLLKVTIVANEDNEVNAQVNLNNKVKVLRCWRRNTFSYPFKIFKAILWEKPNLIHIQHEFLAYGVRKYSVIFPILLFLINLLFKPIVITMHSVIPLKNLNKEFFLKHNVGEKLAFLKKLAVIFTVKLIDLFSKAIIVHNILMKNCLVNEYSIRKNKVFVIPHGVEAPLIENICIKKDLKNNVILFFGFITPDKGVEVLIDAFSKITNILPKVKLLILGSYHPRLYKENPNYIGAIERKLKETKLNDKVIFEDKFVNDNYLQSYIQIADIIVFPYIDENVIGASGALASCINFGKPIIATNIPRFNTELKNGVNSILVNPNDKEELYKALIKLLLDEELRIKLSLNIKNLGKERSWFNIAIKTMEVYNKFL